MKLRELRLSNNISQAELGKIIGVSGQTILNWENGIYEPKIHQLIALAKYFDVSVDYLIGNSVNFTKNVYQELKKIPYESILKFICEYLEKTK